MQAEKFIGMSKKEAQDAAERYNLIFRLVSVDNHQFLGYPEDSRVDRVCVEIEKSKVVKAVLQ